MRPKATPSIRKIVLYAIVMNALQIAAVLAFAAFLIRDGTFSRAGYVGAGLICCTILVVVWGAAIDIQEAVSARKIAEQSQMLEDAYGQLEALNGTLRAQRHDFMNHLQVVFSLTEMGEYQEAQDYITRVYGDIRRIGRVLKTSIPAVNALIAAKTSDCEAQGLILAVTISSNWNEMPVPGWEMCRVLGNLIDNAMDALSESGTPGGQIEVGLGEDLRAYTFFVANDGPVIPETVRQSIFDMGFTTKRAGRGMGLHIVREILSEHGGTIALAAAEHGARFEGTIPKAAGTPAERSEKREV